MLTYGDVPLLLPDAGGELAWWMEANQNLTDLAEFGAQPQNELSPRRGLLNWYGVRKGVGQAVANYSPPPPPRLNSLYWPTGATRWARGYFLATEEQKNKIVEFAHSPGGNTSLKLKWGDKDHATELEASMYLLPPRLISRPNPKGKTPSEWLWLLPLVDVRYWWQFRHTDDLEISDSTSWANVFTTLGTQLGVTVSVPTSAVSAYLKPDPYDFTRRYENAAVMLDAAALSIGKRIVRYLDGTVRAESASDADAIVTENLKKPWQKLAGGDGDTKGDRPEKVLVTFRKWRHYALLDKGRVYKEEIAPSDTAATVSGARKVIHSTCHADCSSSDSSPSNSSELSALAQRIADDYYAWLGKQYDVTFAGAKTWKPSGYDDAVIWDFGRQLIDGRRLAQTRVQTMPVDFGFEHQLSQNGDKTLFEPMMIGKADGNISAGSSGTISVWTGRAGSRTDSGKDVTAWATSAIGTGKWVGLSWVENDWEASKLEC